MPVLTEKTLANYKKENKVTFEIDLNANKHAARKALEEVYGVKVLDASVNNRLGKYKINRTNRKLIKKSDRKIMVFQLDKDSKLDLFEAGE